MSYLIFLKRLEERRPPVVPLPLKSKRDLRLPLEEAEEKTNRSTSSLVEVRLRRKVHAERYKRFTSV